MKTNKFLTLSIIFVIIAVCISSFEDFFRDYLDDSIVIFLFYIFGVIGVILAIIALLNYKRESNKFSPYSVFLVTFIVATILFLIVMPPCQCGR
jgi:cytochrome bd-type quinol oxidase subunit 2